MEDFTPKNINEYPLLTLSEVTSVDIDRWSAGQQLHLNWLQKASFKIFQKRLSRKIKKGKLDKNLTLNEVMDNGLAKSRNRRGKVSFILGAIGLLTMFSGILAILSIPLFIGGLVIGILGISKDETKTMAIVGTIFNGLMLLLILIALTALVAGGLRFA